MAALLIGFIGHRENRLPADHRDKLLADIELVFIAIEDAARAFPPRTLCVLSALAEGADRLGAEAAFRRQWPIDVILPLPRSDYVQDFPTEASRAAFFLWLERASRLTELPPEPGPRSQAYRRAAERMIELSDMMVAVWDGGVAAGPGGTAETVDRFLALGRPLIVIDATGLKAPAFVWRGGPPDAGSTEAAHAQDLTTGLACFVRGVGSPQLARG